LVGEPRTGLGTRRCRRRALPLAPLARAGRCYGGPGSESWHYSLPTLEVDRPRIRSCLPGTTRLVHSAGGGPQQDRAAALSVQTRCAATDTRGPGRTG